jgi:hypothetical protein
VTLRERAGGAAPAPQQVGDAEKYHQVRREQRKAIRASHERQR